MHNSPDFFSERSNETTDAPNRIHGRFPSATDSLSGKGAKHLLRDSEEERILRLQAVKILPAALQKSCPLGRIDKCFRISGSQLMILFTGVILIRMVADENIHGLFPATIQTPAEGTAPILLFQMIFPDISLKNRSPLARASANRRNVESIPFNRREG